MVSLLDSIIDPLIQCAESYNTHLTLRYVYVWVTCGMMCHMISNKWCLMYLNSTPLAPRGSIVGHRHAVVIVVLVSCCSWSWSRLFWVIPSLVPSEHTHVLPLFIQASPFVWCPLVRQPRYAVFHFETVGIWVGWRIPSHYFSGIL
jgi:hypothetical protein